MEAAEEIEKRDLGIEKRGEVGLGVGFVVASAGAGGTPALH
jgi:hypothetical protein